MNHFDFQSLTRVIFGDGEFMRLGELSRELGFSRALLVADGGMVSCGYVEAATDLLREAGIEVFVFHDFSENPDSGMVERGRALAAECGIDGIIGLGGGSSMDCAKGINFVLSGGGTMRDYWGHGKLSADPRAGQMLPMIGIPTTSGTGSEAQSYALISDAETHLKMACGDPQAAFRIAILDPRLTLTQPETVTATAGFDAISHAVESYVTKEHNPVSDLYSLEAWRLLQAHYPRVIVDPDDLEARAAMLLGAHYAGVAIENSMLGATHACANPLTKNFGTAHGVAIAVMLPHVVRWNSDAVGDRYQQLNATAGLTGEEPGEVLARRLEELAAIGRLPHRLRSIDIPASDLPALAEEAARQWTGTFNPRPWGVEEALEVYESAL
ncbi:MAG: iron-containing alcohol dehydrogenase [Acidobacteriota bacterium]|nr:MAG: iron-containing alcohol dehydrogenase [Acidobacteriota bacterium]